MGENKRKMVGIIGKNMKVGEYYVSFGFRKLNDANRDKGEKDGNV